MKPESFVHNSSGPSPLNNDVLLELSSFWRRGISGLFILVAVEVDKGGGRKVDHDHLRHLAP